MVRIDTCGMSCPQPVLMTKKALDKNPEGAEIVVDNNTAKINVKRYLEKFKYSVEISEEGELYILSARK
ncbi:TusA-related sulfurtransferase [Dethiosulfatibacter aminovorans DSM 17477]|uniref:TusA-related sulfurtransferase n=1 Tax=Dethiosulfatibacter aminovorans DSM 17477 TaxID=1121476 RepID=A0A1M6JCY0_9FIRM|nr:sulfurtransferase TusA family protein [Dethiosulfatibacter aminovorans]SHJ44490.1 TusA-related sulfurtransferase [Dethiosulfatibacter aminovorans DSM 17477]